ncbi:Type 1 glutamine amidotransferase-like domain-containing protein [Candidatus Giovannonibacteria bacterium]|nr:Type 1 glutamine amidotransferase-like domain-containing protein [Candidatus Giovannonibacteria bacterium]
MNHQKSFNLYLSGGGDEKQSFSLDKFFFEDIDNKARLLYIPVALRGHKLYSEAGVWMKSVLDLHNRMDIEFELWDDLSDKNYSDLEEFNAIYIGGGNTWNLIKEIREKNFGLILKKYLESGGLIYGGSAGAVILGNRIDAQDDKNEPALLDNIGLNILGKYSVATHYKAEFKEKYLAWVSKENQPLLCLPEETGFAYDGHVFFCIGTKPALAIEASHLMNEIFPGISYIKK